MRPITIHKNRIEISPAYRIVGADVGRFELTSVGSVLVSGLLIVRWSTPQAATTMIRYSYDSPSLDQEVGVSGMRKIHEVSFPQTFIDTVHYYQAVSTAPDGTVAVSDVYKVNVTDVLVLESIIGGHDVSFKTQDVLFHRFPDISGSGTFDSNLDLNFEPFASADIDKLEVQVSPITMLLNGFSITQGSDSITTIINTTVT